jgi:hypothetical protein
MIPVQLQLRRCLLRPLLFSTILLLALCARNNPYDASSDQFIAGDLPRVSLAKDSLITYINDTVTFHAVWNDSGAGGKKGAVERLYFSWDGDLQYDDSIEVNGSETVVIDRAFDIAGDFTAKMWGRDNDGNIGEADSFKLFVLRGSPFLETSEQAIEVAEGRQFNICASASDDNGEVVSFRWAVGSEEFERSTPDGCLSHTIDTPCTVIVYVKAVDDDGMESHADSTRVIVLPLASIDSVGPSLSFLYPEADAVLDGANLTVYLSASDPSGVQSVMVDTIAATYAEPAWRCEVNLASGKNTLVAFARDNKGNLSTTSLAVHFQQDVADTMSPLVTFLNPRPGDTVYSAELEVILQAFDASSVASVLVQNDTARQITADQYRASILLQQGIDTLRVQASDTKGNTGHTHLVLFYDSTSEDAAAPVLSIASPRPLERVGAKTVEVRGTASDPSGIGSVKINETIDATVNYPSWSASVNLRHGFNTIAVLALDPHGNAAYDSVVVLQNTSPAFSTDSSRLTKTLVVGDAYTVTLEAADPDNDELWFRNLSRLHYNGGQPLALLQNGTGVTVGNYEPQSAGIDTLSIEVRDGWGDADTISWRLFVSGLGTVKPFFTVDTAQFDDSVIAAELFEAQLEAQDPNGDTLSYSLIPPSPNSAAVSSGGLVTWTPQPADTGTVVMAAEVSDGVLKDTLQWSTTVFMYNRAPVLHNPGDQTAAVSYQLSFALEAADPDGDMFGYEFGAVPPSGARLDNEVFSWKPRQEHVGSHTIVFIVREKLREPALSDTEKVVISVSLNNEAPVLAALSDTSVSEGELLEIELEASDSANQTLLFSVQQLPDGASLDRNHFQWTPSFEQAGEYEVVFVVADDGRPPLSDSARIRIEVNHVNRAPVFSTAPDELNSTMQPGDSYSDTVTAVDPDGDMVRYTLMQGPERMSVDEASGAVSWSPSPGQLRNYQQDDIPVTIQASDEEGLSDELRWNITVKITP